MKDHTDINILIDASGSMFSLKSDVEGSIKSLVEKQKAEGDNATLTIADFDSTNPFNIAVYPTPINEVVNNYKFTPREMTPLLDALGRFIIYTGDRLSKMDESERPDKVVMMIFTDGLENFSKEFKKERIQSMIEEQKQKYNWEFNFMSSDLSAVRQANSFGFSDEDIAFSSSLTKGVNNYSGKLSNVRGGTATSMAYTQEDKRDLEDV